MPHDFPSSQDERKPIMTRKLITIAILLPLLFLLSTTKVGALEPELQVRTIEAKPVDPRVAALKEYLAEHNSPLEANAHDFVEAADYYQMDWKLVAAISGVESTFGKRIPYPTSYNGWGWGVYGTQSLGFKSWKDGIYTVSGGLKQNYIDQGLTDPYSMNRKYASSKTWGSKVSYFLTDIDEYYKDYSEKTAPALEKNDIEHTVRNQSAGLKSPNRLLALLNYN